jgi:hypothetical protein
MTEYYICDFPEVHKVELNLAYRSKIQLTDPGISVLILVSTSTAVYARRSDIAAVQPKHAKVSVLPCSETPIYQNSHAALRLMLWSRHAARVWEWRKKREP